MERIREKVPELRWVDADEGQLDFQDSRPPVAFPCCLVELSYPGAENMSAAHPGMQRVHVSLELKIGFNDCASFNVNKPLHAQTHTSPASTLLRVVFSPSSKVMESGV